MRTYRCYLLNSDSAVAAAAEILAAVTDEEACQLAASIFRKKGALFSDYEIWDGARLVRKDGH